MDKNKATSPEKKAALETIRLAFTGLSAPAQCERLLAALKCYPISTYEAMRGLDIYAPRPRVHELRHRFGMKIQTHWVVIVTECGEKHRIGIYALESEVH